MTYRWPAVVLIAISAIRSLVTAEPPSPPTGASTKSEWLVVDGPEHKDVGRLQIDTVARHERGIRTSKAEHVTFRVVRSSCPCVRMTFDPPEIKKDQVGKIVLQAPVSELADPQWHWAVVECKLMDAEGKVLRIEDVKISVTYQAELDLVVRPDKLWIDAVRGEETTRTIYLRSSTLDALRIRNLRMEGEGFKVQSTRRFPVRSDARPGEEALAVAVAYESDAPGLHDGSLVFDSENKGEAGTSIPIHVRVREYWLAEPAGYAFLFLNSDRPQAIRVRVRNRRGEPCPVMRVAIRSEKSPEIELPGATATLERNSSPDEVYVVVHATPDRLPGVDGIGSVILYDEHGKVLRDLPLAWIKPTTAAR